MLILYPYLPLIKEWSFLLGNVIEIVLITMVIIDCTFYKYGGKFRIHITSNMLLLFCFLLLYFLLSNNNYDSLSAIRIFLIYYFLNNCFDINKYDVVFQHKAKKILVISGTIMAIGAIIQFPFPAIIKALHNPIIWANLSMKTDFSSLSIYNRSISLLNDPNVMGVFISSIYMLTDNNETIQIRTVFIQILLLLAVVLSQSRTAIFITGFYIIVKWYKRISEQKVNLRYRLVISSLLIVFLLLICIYHQQIFYFLRIDTLINGNGRQAKNANFFENYFDQQLIYILFGSGITIGRNSYVFENSFLMFLSSFGILGTCILMMIFAVATNRLLIKKNVLVIVCFILINCVGDYFYIPQIGLVYLVILNINSSNKQIDSKKQFAN